MSLLTVLIQIVSYDTVYSGFRLKRLEEIEEIRTEKDK